MLVIFMLVSPVLVGTQGRGEYTGSGPERAVLLATCASAIAEGASLQG
ncbi:MAG: hypothetical protein ACRDTC_20330 [Pseudonocardiaceae bacterium]